MIAYEISENTMSILIDGDFYMVLRNKVKQADILELLENPNTDNSLIKKNMLKSRLDRIKEIEWVSEGNITVKGNTVYYRGEAWDIAITRKIVEFLDKGAPVKYLMRFMDRLMDNCSRHIVEQLYPFIEKYRMQITSDGKIIAYKGVTPDYMDRYSRSVYNGPGAKPEPMKSNEVDDNPDVGCSQGYHAGTLEYAHGWGERVMRVLIDPADVKSVPKECSYQKMRIIQYEVLDEVEDPEKLIKESIYPAAGDKGETVSAFFFGDKEEKEKDDFDLMDIYGDVHRETEEDLPDFLFPEDFLDSFTLDEIDELKDYFVKKNSYLSELRPFVRCKIKRLSEAETQTLERWFLNSND